MQIILSEYSAGFSDYSWILCNELIKYVDKLTYLTEHNNDYISVINESVIVKPIFDSFKADKLYKKGSLAWCFNRGMTTIFNCLRRNNYIKDVKPDVILIQATLSTFDCYFLEEVKKYTKIILIVHDVIVPTKSLSWNMKALKRTYELADLLVVHSDTNKNQMIRMFGIVENKIEVIPHGIRSSYRRISKLECRDQLSIHKDEIVFLFYGSIRESKGLDILLEAMKSINALLIIAGAPFYGESFEKYRKIIDRNHIRTIEFIEYTEDSFRDILFQASDYMVLPYKEFYSQSGVFMQSIQYHLPVIATDVSAFREYIEKYDIGYICKAGNIKSLHETLEEASKKKRDYTDQMKHAIKENCWEVTTRMYYDSIKKLSRGNEC